MDRSSHSTLSLKELGVNLGSLVLYAVLYELERGPSSAKNLYEALHGEVAGRRISRTRFYTQFAEMEQSGYIEFFKNQDRHHYYIITDSGRAERDRAYQNVYVRLRPIYDLAQAIRYDLNHRGTRPHLEELPKADRAFFGRLANVFNLISYLVLSQLTTSTSFSGLRTNIKQLQDFIIQTYRWSPSKSHFYDVVHRMEMTHGWICTTWDDEKKRSRRYVTITDAGRSMIPIKAQDVEHEMEMILIFLRSVLQIFDRTLCDR